MLNVENKIKNIPDYNCLNDKRRHLQTPLLFITRQN